MKTIDTFIFFNELDLLEIRLNTLKDKVDKFILVESTVSFAGHKKPLYYEENKDQFLEYKDKIHHYIVDHTPDSFEQLQARFLTEKDKTKRDILLSCLTTSNVPFGEVHWLREFYQKECMKLALIEANCKDEDLCFVSDLDEIWNPEINYHCDDFSIYKCKQHVYSGYLNLRSDEEWYGTYYTKYKNLKNASLNHLDTSSKTQYEYVNNAGWHFTYQGGVDRIKTKIENFGHQEYNNDVVKNNIVNSLSKGKDALGRSFNFLVDEEALPKYLRENKGKYKQLYK